MKPRHLPTLDDKEKAYQLANQHSEYLILVRTEAIVDYHHWGYDIKLS